MLKAIGMIFGIGLVICICILAFIFANYILDDGDKKKEIKENDRQSN